MNDQQSTFAWIERIIDSCKDDFHFDAVDALITLFNERFHDASAMQELKNQRERCWNIVHGILH